LNIVKAVVGELASCRQSVADRALFLALEEKLTSLSRNQPFGAAAPVK
jgi:hypothetical protein